MINRRPTPLEAFLKDFKNKTPTQIIKIGTLTIMSLVAFIVLPGSLIASAVIIKKMTAKKKATDKTQTEELR